MTKQEFEAKWVEGSLKKVSWRELLADLTAVIDEERKLAKIDGYKIAAALYDRNCHAFRAILGSLIEARPPVEDDKIIHFIAAGGQLKMPKLSDEELERLAGDEPTVF